MKALDGYDNKPQELDHELSNLVMEAVFADFQNDGVKPRGKQVLSFDDAVLGVENWNYMNSIPRNTSCGYPDIMRNVPGMKGKERYFGNEPEYNLNNPECDKLREDVDDLLDKLLHGERIEVINNVCVKDELLKLSKVEIGKSRVFMAHPIRGTILGLMLFGSFLNW